MEDHDRSSAAAGRANYLLFGQSPGAEIVSQKFSENFSGSPRQNHAPPQPLVALTGRIATRKPRHRSAIAPADPGRPPVGNIFGGAPLGFDHKKH